MVEAGMEVDLLCIMLTGNELRRQQVNGVNVFRTPIIHQRNRVFSYISNYARFFITSLWFLITRGIRRRYDIVHVHNMPDFLVFSAIAGKLCGTRIILDLHDPMPELMTTIFEKPSSHWSVSLLRLIERYSIRFSNLVITPNIAFKNLFASRSCSAEKIQIVMNSPEQAIFDPDRFPPAEAMVDVSREFRIMHHGLIAHRHGVDLLVEAIALLRPEIPGLRLDIYGWKTPFLEVVFETADRLGVRDIVRFHGPKSQSEIADAIRQCSVGVVPNRRSVFTEINFPTRIFEYLAMHRPVIVPDTQGIHDYFGPEDILMFDADNVNDLAAKILQAHDEPKRTRDCVARGIAIYRKHLWADQKEDFLASVLTLLTAESAGATPKS